MARAKGGTALTRVSTLAKAVDDANGLIPWSKEQTLRGLSVSPDLMAMVAALGIDGDKTKYREVVEAADGRSKRFAAAHLGTAIHLAVDMILKGGPGVAMLPDATRRDAESALACLEGLGIEVLALEQFVVVAGYEGLEPCGGSFDVLGRSRKTGRCVIVDFKGMDTPEKAKYSALQWSAQEALYSRGMPFNGKFTRDQWQRPIVDLEAPDGFATWASLADGAGVPDQRVGLIVGVLRGQGEAVPFRTDLEVGWRAALLGSQIRQIRKVRPAVKVA